MAFDDSPGGAAAKTGLLPALETFRALLGRPEYAFSDTELLDLMRCQQVLAATLDAAKLRWIHELTLRPDIIPGRSGEPAATWTPPRR